MKHLPLLLVAMLAFGAFAATSALAASPHFVGTPTATVSGNTLTVNFKAAGLGNDTTVPITLSGDVTVNSRCYTKSGSKPQAANKQEKPSTSTRRGTSLSATARPPAASLSHRCPP